MHRVLPRGNLPVPDLGVFGNWGNLPVPPDPFHRSAGADRPRHGRLPSLVVLHTPRTRELFELRDLALEACELRSHDQDVREHDGEHDEVCGRDVLLARRHAELVDGQNAINSHLDVSIRANAQATEALTKRLDDNTRLTVENTALAQSIKADTSEIIAVFKAGKTTLTTIDWVAKFIGKVAILFGTRHFFNR